MKKYIGYKVINFSGKQMVVLPTNLAYDYRIRKIENWIKTVNKLCTKLEEIVFFICIGTLTWYITDLIVTK